MSRKSLICKNHKTKGKKKKIKELFENNIFSSIQSSVVISGAHAYPHRLPPFYGNRSDFFYDLNIYLHD